jgi:hypothetical protein
MKQTNNTSYCLKTPILFPIEEKNSQQWKLAIKFNHIDDFLIGSTANKYLGSTDLSKVEV